MTAQTCPACLGCSWLLPAGKSEPVRCLACLRPPAPFSHSVEEARRILEAYDEGEWAGSVSETGHLAGGLRMLLAHADSELEAGRLVLIRSVLGRVLGDEDASRQLALEEIQRIAGEGA
jgi:hypothetical protein